MSSRVGSKQAVWSKQAVGSLLVVGALLAGVAPWLGACGNPADNAVIGDRAPAIVAANGGAGSPARAGRFGSLRDFVLFERAEAGADQALFVDRFEATQGDWAQFAATTSGRAVAAGGVVLAGSPALPVGNVDLPMARAFAAWRFARLPSFLEWQLVSLGDGRSRFPWGSKADPARANTGELGLGEPTPVGTFESGRKAGGDAPYDLVGNVAEWTESVPWRWCEARLDVGITFARCRRLLLATPALSVWAGPGGLSPSGAIVAAGGPRVPRTIAGADFQTPMTELYGVQEAGEHRRRTGFRVYTSAGELLAALLATTFEPGDADRELLHRFVARGRHREVLRAVLALPGRRAEPRAAGPVGRQLLAELRTDDDRSAPR